MKKSLLITAIILALSGGAFAQITMPMLPSAHGLTGNQPAYTAQQQQEFPMMATGWNWWSSYIDLSNNGLSMLETMLGGNASIIKSQGPFTSYLEGEWIGNLSEIDNSSMYSILMTSAPSSPDFLAIRGNIVSTDNTLITAQAGWTWIGFPSSTNTSVDVALQNYIKNEGDVIKSQNAFSSYYDGEWIGTLTAFEPGRGYKIQNNGEESCTFYYATSSRSENAPQETPHTAWMPEYYNYATNMNIIAVINLEGEELRSHNFEVAAFSGNECRGAATPKYIGSLDRYIAFLSISGEDNDLLEFRLLDYDNGDIYAAEKTQNYMTDAVVGSIKVPHVLNFNTKLGNSEYTCPQLYLYPNPVSRGQLVRLSIPGNQKHLTVQVINTLGMTVKNERMNGEEFMLTANMTPGIYTIKIVDNNKQLYIEKLIVK